MRMVSRISTIEQTTSKRVVLQMVALVFAVGALLLGPGALPSAGTSTALTLNVNYSSNGGISMTLPDGTPVGGPNAPGTVIPPGSYSIVFNNKAQVVHMFDLTGPGVKLSTDLRPSGEDAMCGAANSVYQLQTYQETLLPNATYSYQDDYQPAIHGFFSTSASGPIATPVATGSGSGSSKTITGSGTSGIPLGGKDDGTTGTSSTFRGTLTGIVDAGGKLILKYHGSVVRELKAGRYAITVTDSSPKSGFVLQHMGHTALAVAPSGFVGKRSMNVVMIPGQWFFYPGAGGRKIGFLVAA